MLHTQNSGDVNLSLHNDSMSYLQSGTNRPRNNSSFFSPLLRPLNINNSIEANLDISEEINSSTLKMISPLEAQILSNNSPNLKFSSLGSELNKVEFNIDQRKKINRLRKMPTTQQNIIGEL